ncbi:MAG: T9SS type A sorting domain-containing protein [Dysgonamonadaceae bacterium]|jgi:hypothetical protein|nr:T9SS type A sorting domain-containing protein [Dysgonamonadaceae bacterium]
MKKQLSYFLVLVLAIGVLGANVTAAQNVDVYVAGYENNGNTDVAKVWKNGAATNLTDGTYNSEASSVYVSGNDVYVAGYEGGRILNAAGARMWKNAEPTTLPGIGGKLTQATSVFVSGEDVYVAGHCEDNSSFAKLYAKVWKNGELTDFAGGYLRGSPSDEAIFIADGDVYVATSYYDEHRQATLWKNGEVTNLTNGTSSSSALSVFVSGNDVYVAGYEYNSNGTKSTAKIWKNGVVTKLTEEVAFGYAYSVFVSGNDVYVAGEESGVAKVWKNGVGTNLTNGTTRSSAKSVFVLNNDVYVAGYTYNVASGGSYRDFVATLWKNGVATTLTNGTNSSRASSVFVINGNGNGIADIQANNISVYSNPAGDQIIISGLQGNETLRFYNIAGNRLFTNKATDKTSTVSFAHLPAGVYFVSIQTNERISTHKFILK